MNFVKGIDYIGVSVVFFCHDGKGNFLMAKRGKNCRDEHGRWDIGAGGLRFEEKVEEGLKREIMEEYGVCPIETEFLGYRDVQRIHENKPTHWIGLDFKILVDPDKVKNCEPNMSDEIAWFRLDNLPQADQMHSLWEGFFTKYKGKLG